MEKRKHKTDFGLMLDMLQRAEPFTFVRFSDGELEIINGSPLSLGPAGISWSKGRSDFVYPAYDHKKFDPIEDGPLREALLIAARYSSLNFFKGIPTRHNKSPEDTAVMIQLNGNSESFLTFSDLFMNANYKSFLKFILPELVCRNDVVLIGNFRMSMDKLNPNWGHITLPDNAFAEFPEIVERLLTELLNMPEKAIVLCSASSLTNILGQRLHQADKYRTFIDVGTTLHPLTSMPDSLREYQSQMLPWGRKTFKRKLMYLLRGRKSLKW